MSKIKLTKGELKRQRDALSQFRRYLPTLQLKKQQLQMKVLEAQTRLDGAKRKLTECEHGVLRWAALLADPVLARTDERGERIFDLETYVLPLKVRTGQENVAGVYVPVLEEVIFHAMDYDLASTPFWTDRAVSALRVLSEASVEIQIIEKQIRALQKELRTTSQRVNLFEKVKIPEARENIRRITIYLGDQQANAVGISKVAKKKIEQTVIV